ncbi:UNVERIFIED_CONTAM: Palmitoyl-monogalactosyldiacylglycerol delta-7 desaturase, chloroplastic [Sesamum latifolium]|uniref:Palmitoyl-monogalactosyldiacylglycerol delta-7 desaturase, chloroplastic n=1 Tax=Sesamum latifolium TaxID=2727402 RepID=A0AAW2UEH9_9LAMI
MAIVRAAAVPLSGDEKDSSFGRILLSDVVVKRRRNVYWGRKWNSIDVATVGVVVAMHLLCVLAPFTFNWGAFWVAVGLYVITGLLGITLSFHRNLSHRSFKLPKWLEYLFAYCGVQALQGNPIDWVSTHRHHHQFCDSEKDPHSPLEGFWFSHMSWFFDTKAILERCGEPNNVGDLEKQPFYKFLQTTYIIHPLALGALLYAVGGFPYIVWGMPDMYETVVFIVQIQILGPMGFCGSQHLHQFFEKERSLSPWCENRVGVPYHLAGELCLPCLGKQAWNTGDLSRNNWWVAMLAFGEGWHNNHHAFEYSARHGLEWWQIDMTWYVVRLLQAIGLATDVKLPTTAQKQRMAFSS